MTTTQTRGSADTVTARAAYREAIRWRHCERCLLTGPDVLHDVAGVVLCVPCACAWADPAVVAFVGKVVARAAGRTVV
jgi:hypothetical protein